MTMLDLIVLAIVAAAAIGGFLRGMAQELLSFAAWILAAFAVCVFHSDVAATIDRYLSYAEASKLLAFALLLLIPYAAMRVIAANISGASGGRLLGPIDRVLGFGFGLLKGVLIAVFAFSALALGFDESWGPKGRPDWIVTARSYHIIDAASRDMVPMIARRQAALEERAKVAK